MFLTGQAAGFGTMIASRLVMGAGKSTSFPAGNRVIREWMPAKDRGIAMSIFNTGSYFGPALGSLIIGSLIAMLGWRVTFYVCGRGSASSGWRFGGALSPARSRPMAGPRGARR